ncbi:molybdenum cofactor guanylyltransferase [Microbacterium amylolyticum]|uniref:Molybdopterin-guanine dinucleotide biosynthesis protein A n=1 Tax=Microbacterium amylolyticum TaxID=936337 RepID=A0ABS4ZES4_9MICO|nr:NTP transferase domain-containing protein [Microbacterium amylolyticum]MBP2435786.1 molybdopterin-guanine dinucleotide biosynthesis protein A [Microbacterium amylolyticum]
MTTAGVILAGGHASRVGGVDKAMFRIDNVPLLTRAITALSSCSEIIVVGPTRDVASAPSTWIVEDPPVSGPVAALAAALAHTSADDIIVLPADLADAEEAVRHLTGHNDGTDGVVLVDPSGRAQWLTARYRRSALRQALAATPHSGDRAPSLRRVVSLLTLTERPAPWRATRDVDTWEDLQELGGTT